MRLAWPVACVCLLGVFAGALVHSLEYPLRDALGFGPGFFPFCLSVIGVGLSAVLLLQALRGKVLAGEEAEQGASPPTLASNDAASARGPLRALAVLVAMVLAAALLETAGYRLPVLAFVAILLPVLGARSVPAIAITAAAGSFGVFHVFYYWLKVPLPVGALGI